MLNAKIGQGACVSVLSIEGSRRQTQFINPLIQKSINPLSAPHAPIAIPPRACLTGRPVDPNALSLSCCTLQAAFLAGRNGFRSAAQYFARSGQCQVDIGANILPP